MDGDTFTPEDLNPNPAAAAPPAEPTEPKGGAVPPAPSEPTDAAPPEETKDPGQEPAAAEEEAHKPNRLQKRFDEITREKYEAQREADYWRGVAEGRIKPEAPAQPAQRTEAPLPAGAPPRPVFDERYQGDYDSYVTDLAAWTVQVERAKIEIENNTRREQETAQQAITKHLERVDTVRQARTDFDEVVEASPVRLRNELVKEIVTSDLSAELIYHLAKNPQEADRLNTLSVSQGIRELGRLEERLTPKDPPQPPRRISQAPEPVTPIGGRETVNKNLDEMSMEEYAKYEQKRLREKQQRR